MQSYQAARSYFSFLSFLSWCVIVLGGLVAIVALFAIGSMSRNFGGSPLAGLSGIVPGVAIMFAGFMGLVLVQIGRAGVDTAELSQQMLKVARDQLEVSKQGLNQRGAGPTSFAKTSASPETPSRSFGEHQQASPSVRAPKPENAAPKSEFSYRGRRIRLDNGHYLCNGRRFETEEAAKEHLDHLDAVRPKQTSSFLLGKRP